MPESMSRSAWFRFTRRSGLRRLALLGLLGMALSGRAAAFKLPDSPQTVRSVPAKINGVFNLEWGNLLPDEDGFSFQLDTAPVHDYLGENAPPARQTGSSQTNPQFDGEPVRISGYVVPLAMDEKGIVTEFFLVPYFGACIHVPPPPPNQIVYVKMDKGFRFESVYQPQKVTGRLHVEAKAVQMASAAYTLAGTRIEPYE